MIDFFYSDPHFGHKNIIAYTGRPYRSVHEMNVDLCERYRAAVGESDAVLWLGDCSFQKAEVFAGVLASLPGKKLLVRGNHDRSAAKMASLGFDLVMEECITHIAGRVCRVSHYPYFDPGKPDLRHPDRRPRRQKGEVLIHGHTHSRRQRDGSMIHVGVDAWGYGPAAYADVERLVGAV